jgi:hypothetical protein
MSDFAEFYNKEKGADPASWSRRKHLGYVYLISVKSQPVTKIGRCANLEHRFRGLDAVWVELELDYFCSHDHYMDLETILHKFFYLNGKWIKNEWFCIPAKEIAETTKIIEWKKNEAIYQRKEPLFLRKIQSQDVMRWQSQGRVAVRR